MRAENSAWDFCSNHSIFLRGGAIMWAFSSADLIPKLALSFLSSCKPFLLLVCSVPDVGCGIRSRHLRRSPPKPQQEREHHYSQPHPASWLPRHFHLGTRKVPQTSATPTWSDDTMHKPFDTRQSAEGSPCSTSLEPSRARGPEKQNFQIHVPAQPA
jgi:hypothetical protein